jgi:hypothetical protein
MDESSNSANKNTKSLFLYGIKPPIIFPVVAVPRIRHLKKIDANGQMILKWALR